MHIEARLLELLTAFFAIATVVYKLVATQARERVSLGITLTR